MQKVRVFQLAKELKVQSALILELLDRMGCEVKSDLSVLDASTADVVRGRVTRAIEAETKRLREEQEELRKQAEIEARERAAEAAEKDGPEAEPAVAAESTETVEPQPEAAPAPEETPAEPATPAAEEPPEKAPAVETPAAARAPEVSKPQPIAAKPVTTVRPPAPAAGPKAPPSGPPTPGGPQVRKPRVFPAQRVPPPSMFRKPPVNPHMPPPGTTRPGPPGSRNVPPPAPPGGRPMRPAAPPHHARMAPPRRRKKKDKHERETTPVVPKVKPDLPPVPETITLSEGVTVKELGEKLNRKSKDIIAKLIGRGVLATINQPLDPTVAIDVAKEFGSTATILSFEEEAQQTPDAPGVEAELGLVVDDDGARVPRAPVVTVMGHVDHGKTSLLDAIRTTNVVDREAGGITQHIGAYQVEEKGRKITFLDTPGHEAFTLMRARGAKATDIVVLVVAADDGVKPQTLEAIDHAKAADVPMVVAINKIDKPGALPARVKQQLADRDVLVEEYGGTVVSCEVSAKQRTGLDELLEMILLVADLKELTANPNRSAAGVVLEARLDRSKGIVATVLVQEGTLKIGDPFIAGSAYGKVRAMADAHGQRITSVGPSTPVEVMGFAGEPGAGDSFQTVSEEARARQIASFRQEKEKAERQRKTARRSLETLAADIARGDVKELPVLLKVDVQGSLEAIQKAIADLPTDKVRVNVIRSSIGAITQADVLLAAASNAIVIGFNVRPDKSAADLAKQEEVEIRPYNVIYDLLDELKQVMVGMLEPTLKETVLGQAAVRALFRVPKIGVIAGCLVTDGKITRNGEARLLRDNVVIYTGKIGSLRRFKDDASEVKQSFECGIGIANYNDLKEGDVIECFVTEKVAAKSL